MRKKADKKYNLVEDDEMDEEPLVKDKLAKNRESAKISRKRKKVYIELLETKVTELQDRLRECRELCEHYQDCIGKYFYSLDLCHELIMNQEQWKDKANQLMEHEDGKIASELLVEELRIQETSKQINQIVVNKILDNLYPFPLNYLIDNKLTAEVQWKLQQLEK